MAIFEILLCSDNPVNLLVDSGRGTLTIGSVWSFTGESEATICGTVVQPSVGVPLYTAATQYDGCGPCINATIEFYTANTVYNGCTTCDNGETYTTVQLPHPTWTDNYGNSVVQGNAVELGGRNGLNS
jgi:hypothetical protein